MGGCRAKNKQRVGVQGYCDNRSYIMTYTKTQRHTQQEVEIINIKAYLHKYKIQERPICSCKTGEQTVDHVLYDCKIFDEERDRLKAAVMRTDNWPISKNNLIKKFYKDFAKFTNIINFDKMQRNTTKLLEQNTPSCIQNKQLIVNLCIVYYSENTIACSITFL